MTEITRAPLPPLASGTLPKLWLGLFVAVLGGVALAGYGTPPLVDVRTVKPGAGPSPQGDGVASVSYVGYLPNGKVFDKSPSAQLPLAQMVPGFVRALEQMQVGGSYRVHIPASLAFGEKGAVNPMTNQVLIPPNSDLDFTMTLMGYKTAADLERERQYMEQLQAMLASRRGSAAPGSPPQVSGADGAAAAP